MDEHEEYIDEEHEERKEPFWKGPIKWIIGLFLIMLLIVWIIPGYLVKIDPAPSYIPSISEVIPEGILLDGEKYNLSTREKFIEFVDPSDPVIKQTATKIVSLSCASGEKVCHAKALYYFVRDNFDYVSDPVNFEYVEDPKEVLLSGGGDCESGTLLLASLMEPVGIDAEIVFIPGHAFLRIELNDANNKYRWEDGWIYLDWTCSDCEFGKVPLQNMKNMEFFDVY
ncbi:MAG: transglutaminase-like domain-containing protein [Candidatus Woesearchaeota archaeon]